MLVFEKVQEINEPKMEMKMCSNLIFLLARVCYDAAVSQRAFSNQFKMRRRMSTKKMF